MKVAIFGTGMVGRAIAIKLKSIGHEVMIGTRDIEASLAKAEGDAMGNPPFGEWFAGQEGIALKTFSDAAAEAELLFNCTAGMFSIAALEASGAHNLKDKVLLDLANPLDFSQGMPPTLTPVNTDSLGEQIQQAFPDLKVVKTLNTMTVALMVEPTKLKGDHHLFVCGNDNAAKQKAKDVLNSFGWKAEQMIDLGDISNSRGTEMLLPIWLRLWNALGTAEFNFHIQQN